MSYFEKKELEKHLNSKKVSLSKDLANLEHKNSLLSENFNFDFADTLIRKKLKFGDKEEILIKLND